MTPTTERPPRRRWYLLVCRDCGDGQDALVMPFTSARDRGRWAAEHRRGTGHERWWVHDRPVRN